MVGELNDKVRRFGGETEQVKDPGMVREQLRAPVSNATPARRITLDISADQFDAIMDQWSLTARNRPTEVVFRLGAQPVGVMQVIASLFVAPTVQGKD